MALKRSASSILIIRPLPPLLDNSRNLMRLIESAEKYLIPRNIPIHWNLPAKMAETLENMPGGWGKGQNILLPAGDLGAPHLLMTDEEIREDIKRGEAAVLGLAGEGPVLHLPFAPDFQRPDAETIYPPHTLRLLRTCGIMQESLYIGDSSGGLLPATVITGTGKTKPPRGGGILLLEFGDILSLETAGETMRILGEIFDRLPFAELESGLFSRPPGERPGRVKTEPLPYQTPGWREGSLGKADSSAPVPPRQALIADMLGSVAMEDENFTAHFSKGRLCGFSSPEGVLLPRRRSGRFIRMNGKSLNFLPPAAYSFDSRNSRGLREILRFRNKERDEGKIVTDYYFTDDCPSLIMTSTILWPPFAGEEKLEEYGFHELIAFESTGKEFCLNVHTVLPVRKQESVTVGGTAFNERNQALPNSPQKTERGITLRECGVYHITGRRITMTAGDNRLTLRLPAEGPECFSLPVKIRKRGKKFQVLINPWGSYRHTAASEVSTLSERFTLLIDAGPTGAKGLPEPPADRYPEGKPYLIGRR